MTDYPHKIITRRLLKQNYRELILIFATFTIMALAAYFSIGNILRGHLYDRAEEIVLTAGANVRVGLSEAEATLINSYYVVQGMIEQNASKQEILDYLTATTEWMRRREQGLLKYYGIYGYINGDIYDGIGANPGDDFIPQTRLWYQTAIRSGSSVGYTTPYTDWPTGDTIFSAVRNIDVKNGDLVGILTVDIGINWLVEYVGSMSPAAGGYGILLSQNMTLMAHPDSTLIGSQLQDLGGFYEEIALTLRGGGNVFARRIQDSSGGSAIVFFSRIFNGWYVGTVVPYFSFYRDLYISALILVVLGLALSLSLCFILLRFSAAKMRADKHSESKSTFLASMSHEIRTPMNAIIGMAELLLRKDLPDDARHDVLDIKQAGNNLVSIINDILDFSKIEAGKLEIIPAGYLLDSLINDTVNIVRMRLEGKPIRFFTNIDSNIPHSLIGDEVRLRQIMINLLSNSAKYTEKGSISLTIAAEKWDSDQVFLKITVADTGKGMKPEDVAKLFGDFVQVDTKKNRSIEGTGLGLAITKKLCEAMGGDISVESEYGKGSVFTVHIPQIINSDVRFVSLPEQSPSIANGRNGTEMRFTMPHARILIVDDIAINLKVAEGLLAPYNATLDTCLSGAEAIEMVKRRNYDLVFMDHMMPEVDGIEATEAIREWEAHQKKLRENKSVEFPSETPKLSEPFTVPIIALTANAVVGMKEMFIEKGFNGFLSKPIDVAMLDEILNRWIPEDKKVAGSITAKLPTDHYQLIIPGIDTKKGLALVGGKEQVYRKLLSLFCVDAEQRIALLKNSAGDAAALVSQAHAIKGVTANLGAAAISAEAAQLEAACKAEDMTYVKENLDGFIQHLAELVRHIDATLKNTPYSG